MACRIRSPLLARQSIRRAGAHAGHKATLDREFDEDVEL